VLLFFPLLSLPPHVTTWTLSANCTFNGDYFSHDPNAVNFSVVAETKVMINTGFSIIVSRNRKCPIANHVLLQKKKA